jgi:F-type H+-transporting ATPase subunit gamma
MSDTMPGLRRQIANAGDLQSVVRTMRALAASGIGRYERAVVALAEYDQAIALALGACLREEGPDGAPQARAVPGQAGAVVVFGTDQGLVGEFNDLVVDEALRALAALPVRPRVWVVGERAGARLLDAGVAVTRTHPVPPTIEAIDGLVGRLQVDIERQSGPAGPPLLAVFHNRPLPGALYEPTRRQLLPLDASWVRARTATPWPTRTPPQVVGDRTVTLRALIREVLFIALYRACAESLASENASRLAAMQRADRSIDESLEALHGQFDRLRQGAIDAELFDVTAGYELLSAGAGRPRA